MKEKCIIVFKLPGEGNEDKRRLRNWWWGVGVKGFSTFDAILKYIDKVRRLCSDTRV